MTLIQLLLVKHCLYVTSKTFGDSTIGFEIGKKEDRQGNGSSSTFGEFLKVIQIM